MYSVAVADSWIAGTMLTRDGSGPTASPGILLSPWSMAAFPNTQVEAPWNSAALRSKILTRLPDFVHTVPLLFTISRRNCGPAAIWGSGGVTAWSLPSAATCWLSVTPAKPVTTCSVATVVAVKLFATSAAVTTGTAAGRGVWVSAETGRNGCRPAPCVPRGAGSRFALTTPVVNAVTRWKCGTPRAPLADAVMTESEDAATTHVVRTAMAPEPNRLFI